MADHTELNITLTFDGDHWCAPVEDQIITAANISDLQDRVSDAVQQIPHLAVQDTIRVHLNCDTSILPAWLRQNHAHYFNSTLIITKALSRTTIVPA